MFFCEECGARILSDSRFCENCGSPVTGHEVCPKGIGFWEIRNTDEWIRFADYARSNDKDLGLIIFNSFHCSDRERDTFLSDLDRYLYFCSDWRNLEYGCLDLRTECITHCNGQIGCTTLLEDILKVLYQQHKPDYLLIVGNEDEVPCFYLKNGTGDGDDEIVTDLPYMTLSEDDPFEGIRYDFASMTPVGRIPSSGSDNGYALARSYFKNTSDYCGRQIKMEPFGLSAQVWEKESKAIYSRISKHQLFCCPDITIIELAEKDITGINGGKSPTILYFNLHGSQETEYWYGQDKVSYPIAVSPGIIEGVSPGYVIGVEACYGGYYTVMNDSESIMLTALKNGCIAFLGSTAIAYGTADEPGICADIVVRRFLEDMKDGKTAGESYLNALSELLSKESFDTTTKTLIEFGLYGDPSISMASRILTKTRKSHSIVPEIRFTIPDVRNASRLKAAEVDKRIAESINAYAYEKYVQFSNILPETFFLGDGRICQSMYTRKKGAVKEILKVYYDSTTGCIKRTCISR